MTACIALDCLSLWPLHAYTPVCVYRWGVDTVDAELGEATQLCKLLLSGKVRSVAVSWGMTSQLYSLWGLLLYARVAPRTPRNPEEHMAASTIACSKPFLQQLLICDSVSNVVCCFLHNFHNQLLQHACMTLPEVRREYPAVSLTLLLQALEKYKEVPGQAKKKPDWATKKATDAAVKQLKAQAAAAAAAPLSARLQNPSD